MASLNRMLAAAVGVALLAVAPLSVRADKTTAELRFDLTMSYGWLSGPPAYYVVGSPGGTGGGGGVGGTGGLGGTSGTGGTGGTGGSSIAYPDQGNRKGSYFTPAVGLRLFPTQPRHGLIADVDFRVRFDPREDRDRSEALTRLVVTHLGYAYRLRINPRRILRFIVTPHASLSVGVAWNNVANPAYSPRTAVIGGRLGLDGDFHVKRFLFGWSLRIESLRHARPPVDWSHWVGWNVLPLRFGVDFGPELVFSSPPKYGADRAIISDKDARQVRRGRVMLAMGTPLTVAATAGIAAVAANGCDAKWYWPGVAIGSVGIGLTAAGVGTLVRASKEARRAPEPRMQRRLRAVGGGIMALLAIPMIAVPSFIATTEQC